ncbi:hypothetical protein [Bacillus yapensis]|nr:hypothetical protein [Bacillus yapensis]
MEVIFYLKAQLKNIIDVFIKLTEQVSAIRYKGGTNYDLNTEPT